MNDNLLVKVSSWFIITLMPVFIAIAGWALIQIIDQGNKLAILEEKAANIPDITLSDIEHITEDLKDHEIRIRVLESNIK